MNSKTEQSLSVSIRDLPAQEVAYAQCHMEQAAGNFSEQIKDGFQAVKDWATQQGYDLADLKVIGIPQVIDGQLKSYDCCVELPMPVPVNTETIQTKRLAGGQYAVLTLEKDSASIGDSIGRFFAEYVPQNQLSIDVTRPSYEIYYEHIMDFCVPILE